MAKKRIAMDKLGDACIPSDLLTPTDTSTNLLDGFDDTTYGMGSLEAFLGAEDYGDAPGFPTGVTRGAAADMDLTEMLSESLANLDWLDPTQLTDPDRLPKNPVNLMIPELVEAWGVHRRTDGQAVIARDLTRARYEESLKEGSSEGKKASAQQMLKVVSKAMRRSADGHDLKALLKDAFESMGEEGPRIVPHLKHVQAEHGLAGNVFIRAAAYPGYEQGRWGKELKKLGARYVIVTEGQLKSATWIQNGRCTYTGKLAVTKVPWKEAEAYYTPRFEGRVAALLKTFEGTPQERLKRAFLTRLTREKPETVFHVQPSQRLATDTEVRTALANPEPRKVIPNTKSFQGRVATVSAEIKRGLSGDVLKRLIRRTFQASEMSEAVRSLTPLIKKHGSLTPSAKETTYQGAVFTHAAGAVEARTAGTQIAGQVRAAVRWVRQSMSEGFAGNDLDSMIAHRLSPATRSAAAGEITKVREAHEGGSGFLYVDAEAYASPTGRKGCEEAASKHRANQIKAVAEMPRCASCTSARVLEDGTRKCGVYNKLLLANPRDPDLNRLKKANIKAANLDDAELTQSMFGDPENAYDPDEFRLANDNLEGIELELPEHDQVRAVLGRTFNFEV